jgi:hypothetical protein
MPSISVGRTVGRTKKAVLGGVMRYSAEDEPGRFGAMGSYLDTISGQAPGFYRSCGYQKFGSIEGYPGGVTRHWFTKSL